MSAIHGKLPAPPVPRKRKSVPILTQEELSSGLTPQKSMSSGISTVDLYELSMWLRPDELEALKDCFLPAPVRVDTPAPRPKRLSSTQKQGVYDAENKLSQPIPESKYLAYGFLMKAAIEPANKAREIALRHVRETIKKFEAVARKAPPQGIVMTRQFAKREE